MHGIMIAACAHAKRKHEHEKFHIIKSTWYHEDEKNVMKKEWIHESNGIQVKMCVMRNQNYIGNV